VRRSSPKRAQMVLIFGFMGLAVSILYVIAKDPAAQIIRKINC